MPTLNEHLAIVQANMDAIKKIIDGMERKQVFKPIETDFDAYEYCYQCGTVIDGLPFEDVYNRDYCSAKCRDYREGRQDEEQEDNDQEETDGN